MPGGRAGRTTGSGGSRLDDVLDASVVAAGPPTGLLVTAAMAVVAAGLLAVLPATWAPVVGYLVSAVAATLLLGSFRMVEGRRRAGGPFLRSRVAERLFPVVALSALAVSVVHTWHIATDLAS